MTQAAALDFDHVELLIGTVENAADANAKAVRNTVLSPRFYTTDFDAMDKLNIESVRAEWDIMMKEYEGDNNHDHFQRDAAFADEVRELMPQLSPEMRQEFLDFLISSLTSEFSGCILYNEVRKHVKNPDIKQLMTFMARDESRHAGPCATSIWALTWANSSAPSPTRSSNPNSFFTRLTCPKKSAMRVTSPFTVSWKNTRTNAFIPSSVGLNAGATTNSATVNRLH